MFFFGLLVFSHFYSCFIVSKFAIDVNNGDTSGMFTGKIDVIEPAPEPNYLQIDEDPPVLAILRDTLKYNHGSMSHTLKYNHVFFKN